MDRIYRVLYCSRNCIDGTADRQLDQLRGILASSRRNNEAVGITGALLFTHGMFAQVLEGLLEQVESTLERVRKDMRHADVMVLESGFVDAREFPEWSMAFAGSTDPHFAEFARTALPEERSALGKQIGELLRSIVVQTEVHA